MDNLDKIKFKEAESEGWFYKIDLASGDKISFPKKHGYYKEMQAWEATGNVIEPQFTDEELIDKEIKEEEQALASQKSNCERLLKATDCKVISHTKYPGDVPKWKTYREALWAIQDSNKIEVMPEKPF